MKTKTKENKGITLVALVITIIVMLILVGVTLNIALDNNGIIEKTRIAREQQEEASIYDQILAAVIPNRTGIDLAATETSIRSIEGYKESSIQEGILSVTVEGRYGIYQYTITSSGVEKVDVPPVDGGDFEIKITQDNSDINNKVVVSLVPSTYYSQQEAESILCDIAGTPDNIKAATVYFANQMNQSTNGYVNFEVSTQGYDDLCETLFTPEELALLPSPSPSDVVYKTTTLTIPEFLGCIYKGDLTETLKVNNTEVQYTEIQPFGSLGLAISTDITSNGQYTFELTVGDKTATKTITINGIEPNVGKYVWYDLDGDGIYAGDETRELWITLYNNSTYGTQLISANALDKVEIYPTDWTGINENIIENDGILSNIEKVIYIYNNLVTTLNTYCNNNYKNATYVDYARCAGCNPLFGTLTGSSDTNEYMTTAEIENYDGSTWFDKYNGKIKKGGLNFDIDNAKMELLNIKQCINEKKFIYAERGSSYYIGETNEPLVSGGYHNTNGLLGSGGMINLFNIHDSGETTEFFDHGTEDNNTFYYRPVVTLKPEVTINTTTGAGTAESPYTLSTSN